MLKNKEDSNKHYKYLSSIPFLILIVYIFIQNINYYYDDSYISLRYAKHFIEGNGLVWNIGERIQGYTNFLHILLISFFNFIFNNLIQTNIFINLIYYLILFLLLINNKYLKENLKNFNYLNNLIILSSAPIIVWTVGGLETILFTIFILLSFLEYNNSRELKIKLLLISIYLNLAFLTRPDAFIFIVIFFIYIAINHRKNIIYFLIPFLISIIYLNWCYNFYGSFLPNTYYAKSYQIGYFKQIYGLKYIFWFLSKPYFFLLIYLLFKLYLKDFKLELIDSIIIFYSLYIVYVGGDHMVSFRFFVPIIPFLSIKIFQYIKSKNIKFTLVYFVAITLGVSQLFFSSLIPNKFDKISEYGKLAAEYINSNFPKQSTIAINTAGSIPYFADDYKYIDMLGLNDTTISKRKISKPIAELQHITGHSKGDGKYILTRKPDYIILGSGLGTKDSALFLSDYELLNSSIFRDNYIYIVDTILIKRNQFEIIRFYKRIKN